MTGLVLPVVVEGWQHGYRGDTVLSPQTDELRVDLLVDPEPPVRV